LQKRVIINNQIRVEKVRLIDENGKQLGIVDLNEAIRRAQEKGLDLIKVTEKVEPPVCKIMDYGKYLYRLKKKEKEQTNHQKKGDLKIIRLTFAISSHDLKIRTETAQKFLEKGYKVKVIMFLRGREKGLADFAKEKFLGYLEGLNKNCPLRVERELKKEGNNLTIIVSKAG